MTKTLLFLLLFLNFSFWATGQKTQGKVYGSDKVLEDVYIENLNTNQNVFSTEKGDFKIAGAVGDTLRFSFPFYHTAKMVLETYHFEESWVMELRENINELETVNLNAIRKDSFGFDEKNFTAQFNSFLKKDIAQNPGAYYPKPSGSVDFKKLAGLLVHVFKKKKGQDVPFEQITLADYKNLFDTHSFFTEELLMEQFHIKKEYHNLFLDYCESKQLDGKLLSEENEFELLNELIVLSKDFKLIIQQYEQIGEK